jgi:hypothetical protein
MSKTWDEDFELDEEHESFGMVSFHRQSGGGGQLFGSHLANHHETIVLEIKRGVRQHGLSHDWTHGRSQLIEVVLSPAQFAQLLTSMNFGDGVPCTIRRLLGKQMEPVPASHEPEQVKILKGVKRELGEMVASMAGRRAELSTILAKKSIVKKDRERLAALTHDIFRWFESNGAFAFRSFEESAERVVTAAKAQVDEFVLATFIKAGMEKLTKQFELPESFSGTRALPPKKDSNQQR